MVEILIGEKGGEYQITPRGNKYYKSALIGNEIKHYDEKISRRDDLECRNTLPCGLPENDNFIDWEQTRSQVEGFVDFSNAVKNTKLNEQELSVLNGIRSGLNQTQIAEMMNLSKSRISQILGKFGRSIWNVMEPQRESYGFYAKAHLRRLMEKFPVESEKGETTFRQARKKDIEMFGEGSVYSLIPLGFPEKKTGLITKTFDECKKCLGEKELTKKTLMKINIGSLRDEGKIDEKSMEFLFAIKFVIVLRRI